MSKARIFVSSTCFDLSAVRESLREVILALGHEPILSEYPSFPVLPELKTLENCKKVVRENSDIFLLIVGGRRGSLDASTGKPIVNLEYQCAKEQGIDSFVFVRKAVLDLMPIWEKNPTADFLPHVDFPEVFRFVKDLRDKHRWTFPFDQTTDIKDLLSIQLSVLLRDLLSRKRAGKLQYLKEFSEESERAQELAREKPRFWEYLLTEELLRTKLGEINRRFGELEGGLVFRNTRKLGLQATSAWLATKFTDLINLANLFAVAIPQEIPAAWGAPGQPGDALAIKRAVDRVFQTCNELLEWETDLVFVEVPEKLQKLKNLMQGTTKVALEELNRLPAELARPFRESPEPKGEFVINLTFRSPPNIELVNEELSRLSQETAERPWQWVE